MFAVGSQKYLPGTVSDNIRYGRLDATQAEVNEAARKAEAWQFISALPEGMKTRVGDRYMNSILRNKVC